MNMKNRLIHGRSINVFEILPLILILFLICGQCRALADDFDKQQVKNDSNLIERKSNGVEGHGSVGFVGGIGGKSADDFSLCFDVTDRISRNDRFDYDASEFINPEKPSVSFYFAFEFNMYADGDAVAAATYDAGYIIFRYMPDGSFVLGGTNPKIYTDRKFERGKWHRVAVASSAPDGGRFSVYCDGIWVGQTDWFTNKPSAIGFGVSEGAKGKAACSDVYKFKLPNQASASKLIKEYPKPGVSVKSGVQGVLMKEGSIYVDTDVIKTPQELFDLLEFEDVSQMRIFDFSLNTEIKDVLLPNSVLVTENGEKIYSYTPIKEAALDIKNFEFTGENGNIGAKAVLDNGSANAKSGIMIMVLKNSDGVMVGVYVSESAEVAVGESREILILPVPANGNAAEVFFLKDWSKRLRLSDKIYNVSD